MCGDRPCIPGTPDARSVPSAASASGARHEPDARVRLRVDRLDRPAQVGENFSNRNQPAAFTLHGLFSHAPQK